MHVYFEGTAEKQYFYTEAVSLLSNKQLVTSSYSDLMLVSTDSIVLLELSVVTNTQHDFLAARNFKEDGYGSLLLDLQQAGFLVDIVTFEVAISCQQLY